MHLAFPLAAEESKNRIERNSEFKGEQVCVLFLRSPQRRLHPRASARG